MKNALVILFLIVIAWLIKSYQRYVDVEFGFDLTLLVCILTSYTYGTLIGFFTGFSALFLATSWNGRYTPSVLFGFILLFIISLIVPGLTIIPITILGIVITIIYDIIQFSVYMIFLGGKLHKALLFATTHTVFNVWAFIVLAPKFLSIM